MKRKENKPKQKKDVGNAISCERLLHEPVGIGCYAEQKFLSSNGDELEVLLNEAELCQRPWLQVISKQHNMYVREVKQKIDKPVKGSRKREKIGQIGEGRWHEDRIIYFLKGQNHL